MIISSSSFPWSTSCVEQSLIRDKTNWLSQWANRASYLLICLKLPIGSFRTFFSASDYHAFIDTSSKIPRVPAPIAPVATINSLDIAREAAKLLDKATRVVIERMDNPNQESQYLDFFQKLAFANRLPPPKKAHRHQCSSKFCPLKLQFDSSTDRDNFLLGYHKIHSTDKSLLDIFTQLRVRRDLTKPELETLRTSQKFCYDHNKIAGESKYIMSDINYKVNSKPRPFI